MSDRSRRSLAALFGAVMGLAYSLVALSINPLLLPGIPLYQPPPGRLTTILLSALLGGILGMVAAWPEDAIPGVILSAITGIALSSLYTIFGPGQGNSLLPTFIVFVFTFLPRALLFLPLALLVRWLLSNWDNALQSVDYSIGNMLLGLFALLAVAGLAGLFSIYPQDGRKALRAMDALVQAGLQASTPDKLPAELKPVDGFLQVAQGAYNLELSDHPELLNVPIPTSSDTQYQYAVFARFESGFRFGCIYYSTTLQAVCSTF